MTTKQQDQAWVESQRADNAKAAKRHRDAITGQYVDEDHVRANPSTTVTEKHEPKLKMAAALDDAKLLFAEGWKVDEEPGQLYAKGSDHMVVSVATWALMSAIDHGWHEGLKDCEIALQGKGQT